MRGLQESLEEGGRLKPLFRKKKVLTWLSQLQRMLFKPTSALPQQYQVCFWSVCLKFVIFHKRFHTPLPQCDAILVPGNNLWAAHRSEVILQSSHSQVLRDGAMASIQLSISLNDPCAVGHRGKKDPDRPHLQWDTIATRDHDYLYGARVDSAQPICEMHQTKTNMSNA